MSCYLGIIFNLMLKTKHFENRKLDTEVCVNNHENLTLAAGAAGFLAACLAFLASLAALKGRHKMFVLIILLATTCEVHY